MKKVKPMPVKLKTSKKKAPAPKMPLPKRPKPCAACLESGPDAVATCTHTSPASGKQAKRPAHYSSTPISAAARELDKRRKGRPVGVLEALGKLAEFLGGAVLLAVHTPESAVRAAGGSFIEAMGGHKCGPDCWHAPAGTPEERKAWWDKTLADYDARRHTSRCTVRQNNIPHEQCTLVAGHAGAHRDAAWRDGKSGGVSWWT